MLNNRNRKNKNYWWLLAGTVLAIFLLFLFWGFVRSLLSDPLIFFTKPLWQASDNLGTIVSTQITGLADSRQELLIENENLRDENNRLRILLVAKKDIEADNLKLRTILGWDQVEVKPIVARVIFLPNFVPYNNLLLDIGSANSTRSFEKGDLVVVDGAILIGRLIEIGKTYTKVKLISSETNLAVVIGDENIPAMAVGSGAGNFTVTLPKDTPISVGDRVTVPLFKDYLIGLVGYIEKLPSRPTQTILIKTPINLWQLKWLEIYDAKT